MSSKGILSPLAGVSYARKVLRTVTIYSDVNVLFMERNRLSVLFARTRLREKISWFHIKKYTPRLLMIKPLI